MSFFTYAQIAQLEESHREWREKAYEVEHKTSIEYEIDRLNMRVLLNKGKLFQELKDTVTHGKRCLAKIDTIRSFDFSKVGGKYAYHVSEDGTVIKPYGTIAEEAYPASYSYISDTHQSKFNLWKSKDFLKKLAEKLKLPENVFLKISSVPDFQTRLFKDDRIREYNTAIYMVYCFK